MWARRWSLCRRLTTTHYNQSQYIDRTTLFTKLNSKKIPNISYSKWTKTKFLNEKHSCEDLIMQNGINSRLLEVLTRNYTTTPHLLNHNLIKNKILNTKIFSYQKCSTVGCSYTLRYVHTNTTKRQKSKIEKEFSKQEDPLTKEDDTFGNILKRNTSQRIRRTNTLKEAKFSSLFDNDEYDVKPVNRVENISDAFNHKIKPEVQNFITENQNTTTQDDLSALDTQIISELFPTPKVTMNNMNTILGKKIYDVSYKQIKLKHKGKHSSTQKTCSWTATIHATWPDKAVFESNAYVKSVAANKVHFKFLYWLYTNGKINKHGQPIYSQDQIKELKQDINVPLSVSITEENEENIHRIINTFYKDIEPILNDSHDKILKLNSSIDLAGERNESDFTDEVDLDVRENEVHSVFDLNIATSNEFRDPIFGISPEDKDPEIRKRRSDLLFSRLENRPPEISLPIKNRRKEIIKEIESHNAVVIRGAPGCGKSTRVPWYVLDSWSEKNRGADCGIIVSEPRRVAALSLASRVAEERGEQVGDVCGYQVRLSTKLPQPPGGAILYCTAGALLRRLASTPDLPGCTHLIIDEAHERSADSDAAMALAKRAMALNKNLRVIIMSATIDTEMFSNYFGQCPILEIPGFTYPVESHFLEDLPKSLSRNLQKAWTSSYNEDSKPVIEPYEVVQVVKWIDGNRPHGAILVFLPGWSEIRKVKDILDHELSKRGTYSILPIHSRLSNADQQKIFSNPPDGVRKIILATNIAETSITVNDVSYVVDTGVHKEQKLITEKGISSLNSDWVSRANVKQRKGRAGRVKVGECYHLYTKEKMNSFHENPVPEILRVPLEKTVLDCKTYSENERAIDFLQQFPQPPSVRAIETAVKDLVLMGALDKSENLTALGKRIVSFTTHPKLSKALVHSAIFKVASPILDLATVLSNNTDLFSCSVYNKEEIRKIKRNYHPTSDHLAIYWLNQHYLDYKKENGPRSAETFCRERYVRRERIDSINDLREIYADHLKQCKILPSAGYRKGQKINIYDDNSHSDELIKGVLYSGLNTLLYVKNSVKTTGKLSRVKHLSTDNGQNAFLTTDSVNHNVLKQINSGALLYCGAIHSQERRGVLAKDTSMLSPLSIFIFSQQIKKVYEDSEKAIFEIPNKWIKLQTTPEQGEILTKYRNVIWSTVNYYIENEGFNNSLFRNYAEDTNESGTSDHNKVNFFRNNLLDTLIKVLADVESEIPNV